MIEFRFKREHELWRKACREFVRDEIVPMIKPDEKGPGHGTFDWPIVKKMAKQGFFGVPFPREYGGAGLGEVGYCMVLEELAAAEASLGTTIGAHTGIGTMPIWLFGTEEQRQRYLPQLCSGERIAAFCLTEPTAGSDAASIKTRAVKDKDEWVLNGTKIWVTNGKEAEVYTVMAVTDPALGAQGGVTSFIVEKGAAGMNFGTIEDKMGIRNSSTAEIIFENCRIPDENRLGPVGEGFITALTALDGGRVGLGAGALGGIKQLRDACVRLARHKVVDGQPLGEHQSIQWKLADMAMEAFFAEFAIYDTATMVDAYHDHIAHREKVPRALREEVSRRAAMIKAHTSEVLGRSVEWALEVFGSDGILDQWTIEKAFRDEPILEIFEGTNEIQRVIIARELLKEDPL